jgi:hypothetical protein
VRVFAIALGLLSVGGCRSAESAPAPAVHEEAPRPPAVPPPPGATAGTASSPRKFGAEISPSETLTLGRILSEPDQFADKTVTVQAKVRRNCTRRGCWMELAEKLDPTLPGCRVTFKDYGFFVPLDSAGSTAKVQGTVQVQSVSPGEVQHLESEGAKFASKQADGSAREVRLVATGVELYREQG